MISEPQEAGGNSSQDPPKQQMAPQLNLFQKLAKAIKAVESEPNNSMIKNVCSLIDKMTPRLFLKAC